ncbi:hypothetical protein JCM19233_4926 [Vibrio astriarenae]|nr:hypothetical protein JCM19233_4926 [Vibrio sp. C7]
MLTTPTPVTSKIYTFAIVGRRRTLLGFKKRIRYISAIGKTEQEARQTLSGLRLVFVSRTPINRKEVAW